MLKPYWANFSRTAKIASASGASILLNSFAFFTNTAFCFAMTSGFFLPMARRSMSASPSV